MGGDGGSVPKQDWRQRGRAKAITSKKTAAQVTFGRSRLLNWTHCSLTKEILQEPICCDDLGNLYNKMALIEAMINKTLPKALSYIKKIKRDTIQCNVTWREDKDSINVNDDENGGIIQCPISGLIGNGKYPFVCLRKCRCIISQRALDNVKGVKCLICGQDLDQNINEYTRIPIHSAAENKEKLFKEMMERRKEKKQRKLKRKESKKKMESKEDCNADDGVNRVKDKKNKKRKKREIEKMLESEQKESMNGKSVLGKKRVLNEAEESVSKKMKTSHVFASIFDRKQRDFNFAGGGKGF